MSTTHIDLKQIFENQAKHAANVARATTAFNNALAESAKYNETAHAEVVKCLDEGQTTGDNLRDNAIRVLGLNKHVLEKILAFSKRLIASKGQELLIAHEYSVKVVHRGPMEETRSGDHVDCRSYYFGKLTGEALELGVVDVDLPYATLTLPFGRYISWGKNFRSTDLHEKKPVLGKKVFRGLSLLNLGKPTATQILAWITGQKSDTSIFIGDEINHGIEQGILALNLEDARKTLYSATPEEWVAGESI